MASAISRGPLRSGCTEKPGVGKWPTLPFRRSPRLAPPLPRSRSESRAYSINSPSQFGYLLETNSGQGCDRKRLRTYFAVFASLETAYSYAYRYCNKARMNLITHQDIPYSLSSKILRFWHVFGAMVGDLQGVVDGHGGGEEILSSAVRRPITKLGS